MPIYPIDLVELAKTRNTLRFKAWMQANGFKSVIRQDPCSYCGGPGGTIDHIYPRAPLRKIRGGLKTGFDKEHWTNYTGACLKCNNKKGSLHLLEFLVKRGHSFSG